MNTIRVYSLALLSSALTIATATPASAVEVLDTFDSENGGVPQNDRTTLTNFLIGPFFVDSFDLLGPQRLSNVCAGGGASLCVGLRASSALTYKHAIDFQVGDTVGVAFDVRRGAETSSPFRLTFNSLGGAIAFNNIESNFVGIVQPSSFGFSMEASNVSNLGDDFQTKFVRFTAGTAGRVQFTVGGNTRPLIFDNFVVTMPGGVPEPATWAVLTIGFGAIGSALRGRHRPKRTLRAA